MVLMDFFEVGGSSSCGRLVVEVSQLADVDVNQDCSAPSDPAVGLTVAAGLSAVAQIAAAAAAYTAALT